MRQITAAFAAAALVLPAACSDNDGALVTDSVAATASASAAQTSPVSVDGPSQSLGDGKVWTYVISGADGKPVEVGVRLNGAGLNGLATDLNGMHPTPTVLTFPSDTDTGVLDHVEFYWNPQGHEPPGVWDKPHFDYHFYLTDQATVRAIDPAESDFATKAAHLPEAQYIPTDFVAPPGEAVVNTVPGMGLHWLDETEPPVPGQYRFTETLINGSYDGTMTFIEPMITREWLLTQPSLNEQLKAPQAYQTSGLWPTTYTVRYYAALDEYSVALGGFVDRQAS